MSEKSWYAAVGGKQEGPYTLEELKHYTADFLPHPNCRSTVVRKPLGDDPVKVNIAEVQ